MTFRWHDSFFSIFHTIFLVPVRWYCIVLDVDGPFLFCWREKTKTRIHFKCFIFRPTFFLRYTYGSTLLHSHHWSKSALFHVAFTKVEYKPLQSDTFTSVVVHLKIDLSNFFFNIRRLSNDVGISCVVYGNVEYSCGLKQIRVTFVFWFALTNTLPQRTHSNWPDINWKTANKCTVTKLLRIPYVMSGNFLIMPVSSWLSHQHR